MTTTKKRKKGEKLFLILIKLLGKKGQKDALIANFLDAIDTNRDGKNTFADFAKGNWKKTNWPVAIFSLLMLAGLVFFGMVSFMDLF